MTLIDGIGDEVTHFFIIVSLVIILIIAWWTTYISDNRNIHAVVLLGRQRSRRSQQLTNHTESATISEGTSGLNNLLPVSSGDAGISENVNIENKPPEASTSNETQQNNSAENSVEEEQNAIVETMDNGTSVLRQRRLAFYGNRRDTFITTTDDNSRSEAEGINLNESDILMEHNFAEHKNISEYEMKNNEQNEASGSGKSENNDDSNIRIKLKYINDDLKLVDGKLQEQLGNFKRRHFEREMSTNKLVRLIFNGQVLQHDNQTLESCGLFDNCVVHCLVHPQRINSNDGTSSTSRNDGFLGSRSQTSQLNNNSNNQGREWDLGNLLFALISFILGSAWYFRYVYAHLYTVTATVALVAVTGIFTVVLIGMYFPEHEQEQQNAERAQS